MKPAQGPPPTHGRRPKTFSLISVLPCRQPPQPAPSRCILDEPPSNNALPAASLSTLRRSTVGVPLRLPLPRAAPHPTALHLHCTASSSRRHGGCAAAAEAATAHYRRQGRCRRWRRPWSRRRRRGLRCQFRRRRHRRGQCPRRHGSHRRRRGRSPPPSSNSRSPFM